MWESSFPAIILAAGLTLSPFLVQSSSVSKYPTGVTTVAVAVTQNPSEVALLAGDAVRGKTIFEGKGNCMSCHRVNGNGSLFGPDLSAIGAPPRGGGGRGARGGAAPAAARGGRGDAGFGGDEAANARIGAPVPAVPGAGGRGAQGGAGGPTPQQLAESILDPNATVSVQNRYVVLRMKDGTTITGKLLSIDTFAIQIFESNEKLANISKDNVREMTMASPMPSYRGKLTTQELADVISYLISLRGQ